MHASYKKITKTESPFGAHSVFKESTAPSTSGLWNRKHAEGQRSAIGEPEGHVGLEPTAHRRRVGVEDPPDEDRVRRRDRRRNPLPPSQVKSSQLAENQIYGG